MKSQFLVDAVETELFSSFILDFFEKLDDIVLLIDKKENIAYMNPAAKKYYDCEFDNVVGQKYQELCSKKNKKSFFDLSKSELFDIKNNNYKSSFFCIPDSSYDSCFIEWKFFDLKNQQGITIGFLITGKDVSDKIKLEKQDKIIKNYLETISSSMPGNFYWKDTQGHYLGCNQALVEMLGFNSKDDVIGKTDQELWPDESENLRENDQKVFESGVLYSEETISFGSRKMYFTVIKMPLRDAEGNVIGIIGNSLDITELKNTQAALQKAKEAAESSERAKTEFIANMSHDVKTPLTGIIGISDILRPTQPDEESRTMLNMAYESGHQLMAFFENCMEMAKLESAQLTLIEEWFSISEVIDQLQVLFNPTLSQKKLAFAVNYHNAIPEKVFGSRPGFYRILLNILGNAIKFTHRGSVTIDVSLDDNSDDQTAHLNMTVEDTGIGMDPAKLEHIFERFTRLTPSYKATYEGQGLGLYVVKKYVLEMGGSITVSSQPKQGSRFVIKIPFSLIERETPDPQSRDIADVIRVAQHPGSFQSHDFNHTTAPAAAEIAEPELPMDPNAPKVLLVEDNPVALKVARNLLVKMGFYVETADHAFIVLDMFEANKYSFVFMDVGLPDLEGTALTRHLRKMEKVSRAHVPIIALSAHAVETMKAECLAAGMDDVLSKPLSEEKAWEMMTQYGKFPEGQLKAPSTNSESSVAPTPNSSVSDENVDISPDADRSMLLLLMQSLPESEADIAAAYRTHDIKELIKAAHKLHGGLCYTGTPRLRYVVRVMEATLQLGRDDQLDDLYNKFTQAVAAFKTAFNQLPQES